MSFPPQGILGVSRAEFDAHRIRHQNPGADEIDVTGLKGLLEDDQHVLDDEVAAIVAAFITAHAAIAAAHHARYTDAEARAAAVSDTAYGGSWDGVTTIAPSKNAVYNKIQTLAGATFTELDGSVSTTAAGEGLGDGEWGDWDISVPIPVGATVVLVGIEKNTAIDTVGVREGGTAIVRTFVMEEPDTAFIPTKQSPTRTIGIMSADVSDGDRFRIFGYWS